MRLWIKQSITILVRTCQSGIPEGRNGEIKLRRFSLLLKTIQARSKQLSKTKVIDRGFLTQVNRVNRVLIGQLNWVSSQSRPDISYEVCRLSTVLNKATVDGFLHANKVVQKLKQRQVSLKYGCLKKP